MENLPDGIKNSGALEIRDRLGSISGGRVLDVGTQEGSFIGLLMKMLKDYESIVGIDISEEDLRKAREEFKDGPVEFELMSGEKLTFDDDSFDTVCMSHTVHHLENIESVLSEMKRVLKPGGYMIIQEQFSDGDQSDAQNTETLVHHLDATVDTWKGIPHFETLSRHRLNDHIAQLGMGTVEVFQSSRLVQCLVCKEPEDCEDPRSKRNVEEGFESLDSILENAAGHPEYDKIVAEAGRLRERIQETGYMPASLLFFICRNS
ncbi:MAG: class I SAM-dependent methyltransferase [Candidatus Thorarchaeota archaeon]|nr:MAG: class I SAM-dependent methyltransferase [Candidatus Thorarchaeota archaeon]